ncbi:MAG: hypothetical protein AAFR88_13040, partial [Pseudomonadota bacterium]
MKHRPDAQSWLRGSRESHIRQSRGSAGVLFTAPAPIVGSGGHRTILNAANKVARLGEPVSVMFERFS